MREGTKKGASKVKQTVYMQYLSVKYIYTCTCICNVCVSACTIQVDIKNLLGLPYHVFREAVMKSKGTHCIHRRKGVT